MFSNKDYCEYFGQLAGFEREMGRRAKGLFRVIKDPQSRFLLADIIRDEERHSRIVKKIVKLFFTKNGKGHKRKK